MKKYRLGEIAEVIGGVTFNKADIATSGIRILRGGNIQNGEICLKEDDVYLPHIYKDNKNTILEGDTILVASTGSVEVLGKAATAFSSLGEVQIGAFLRIIRPKKTKYAALISAHLQSSQFREYIQKQAKGTSINNIRNEYLINFLLYVPNEDSLVDFSAFYHTIQRKIALNRAINHNLEAMAKQLYDYWFVQFNFPNENDRPYKSSGSAMAWNDDLKREIPEEWNSGVFSDVANITMGQSPDGSSYNEDGEGTIFYQGSTDFGMRFPSVRMYTTSPSRFANRGDILMSVRAPVGAVNIANADCCIGRGLSAINAKIGSITYIYYVVHYLRIRFDSLNTTGTTFGSITKDELLNLPVVVPSDDVIERFESVCKPIFDKQMEIGLAIEQLTTLRDSLLPLLMNGQASVNYDLSHD
jgi:putative uncharacterized protein (fragment)